MRYGSVCSGIEAATQAWHPLGWTPAFFSEIEKFPSAVLAHHYGSNMPGEPLASNGVPNLGDMTKFKEWPDYAIDLLVGGTPCQSFSVAGLRKGLDDPRGNLMLTFGAVAQRYRPRWIVWENVPGVLSSHKGRDFGTFLGMLGQLGYGFAYRVLDAQYVRTCRYRGAVPQRRRRVFVVGYLGDWRRAAAVLFDGESLSGNPPPRREARQDGDPTLSARTRGGTGRGTPIVPIAFRTAGDGAVYEEGDVTAPLTTGADPNAQVIVFSAKDHGEDTMENCSPTLMAGGHSGSHANAGVMPAVAFDLRGREGGAMMEGPHDTANLRAASGGSSRSYVAFDMNQITSKTNRSNPDPSVHHTLPATSCPPHLATAWAVRRLTPNECHRLQGFPDDFCNIPWRGKDHAPVGPQYKALGNSMAVNVMEWIGRRIQMVEQITEGKA